MRFFLSSRRRHTRWPRDWSSDVCSSDLLAVDRRDNVWIVQRPRTLTSDERAASNFEPGTPPALDATTPRPQGPIADCCLPAPSVMQFDGKGNLLRAWG